MSLQFTSAYDPNRILTQVKGCKCKRHNFLSLLVGGFAGSVRPEMPCLIRFTIVGEDAHLPRNIEEPLGGLPLYSGPPNRMTITAKWGLSCTPIHVRSVSSWLA